LRGDRKGEGRRKKQEGRGKKEEGRSKREEARGMRYHFWWVHPSQAKVVKELERTEVLTTNLIKKD